MGSKLVPARPDRTQSTSLYWFNCISKRLLMDQPLLHRIWLDHLDEPWDKGIANSTIHCTYLGCQSRGGLAEVAADQQHPANDGQHPVGLGWGGDPREELEVLRLRLQRREQGRQHPEQVSFRSSGMVAQSLECPSNILVSVQLYWCWFKCGPEHKVVGKS